jgi:hypothetical protein
MPRPTERLTATGLQILGGEPSNIASDGSGVECDDIDRAPCWDPADPYPECRRGGRFEIDDPNGLLSCTESLLDQQLFADSAVYDLFVNELEVVLETMTVDRFAEISTNVTEEVTQHFDDSGVVAAMVELDPPTDSPTAAREAVQSAAFGLADQFTERRSALLGLIAT